MEGFVTHLPNTLIGWASFVVALSFSIVLAYLAFMRQRDGADDRLIKILQGTVEELEKKVEALETEQEHLTKQVTKLQTTNDTLTKVLQGRDEATVLFQNEARQAIILGRETNEIARATNQAVKELADVLSKHYKTT